MHDGIDVAKIGRLPALDVHAEFWLPHGAPVIANVGALVGHKGQKYPGRRDAARAARGARRASRRSSAKASCARALERQIKELRLEKHVLLAGFREDVLQLVKSADLFVMSSVTEGLGSTVLDAMAMRLAVVGTRAGGIPEAVVHGETGLLVPPADPRALAGAMVRLLKDHGAAAADGRSRARARDRAVRRRAPARRDAGGLSSCGRQEIEDGGVEVVGPAQRQRVIGAGDDFQRRAGNLFRLEFGCLPIARRVAVADDHERRGA